MKKSLYIFLIVALLVLDWLAFHDILKGEPNTFAEYLMGIVSIPLLIVLMKLLLKK